MNALKVVLWVIGSLVVAPGDCKVRAADAAAVDRMRNLVHAHQQLYGASCIPTAVELVLMLSGRVPASYYDLQLQWKAAEYGTSDGFVGRPICGLIFRSSFTMPRCPMFPFKGLFAAIDAELAAGRLVIIGLRESEDGPFHAWVIVEHLADGEYRGFSKDGMATLEATDIRKRIIGNGGTEIDTYTVDGPPSIPPAPTPTPLVPPPPYPKRGA